MSYYARKRVLVPGGAGFIGANLVKKLLADGAIVTVIDNFSTGRRGNLSEFDGNPDFEVIEHDVIEPITFNADIVINLACPASPAHYQRDPVATLRTSVIGANNLLTECLKSGARFVQASTSEVYGDPLEHPQNESYWGNVNPVGARACYDEGKRAAEALTMDFHRMYGVDVRIARIFNTYGPKMTRNDGRAVSNFMVQALAGEGITVYGDGTATRSFCYIDDMVAALMALGSTPDIAGEIINLGNPDEFTVMELVEKILKLTRSKSNIVFKELPEDDPKKRKPDIEKAMQILGWQPNISLDDGLLRMLKYFAD